MTILGSVGAHAATYTAVDGDTALASSTPAGTPANGASYNAAVSADGRYTAFSSWASDLVAGDGNKFRDVFLYDNTTDTIERVSLGAAGGEGDFDSLAPALSTDGRYVAFQSYATNLVADNNGVDDIFVRDTVSATTTRVSVATGGNEADGESTTPSISGDGRFIVFRSSASNLIAGDTNNTDDVFVHDAASGTTTRVSVANGGGQANGASSLPAVSSDGRYVAFSSEASNLVAGDTNGAPDIFVRDTVANTTTRITTAASDNPSISGDGRFIAYESRSHVWVHDAVNQTTKRVSLASEGTVGNGFAGAPSISADGRHVAYYSYASNLVADDTNGTWDVFVRDIVDNTTTRASLSSGGTQSTAGSYAPAISGNGQLVAFESGDGGFATDDANGSPDVFVRSRAAASTPQTTPTTTPTSTSSNPCANPTLVGTNGNDTLTGTPQRDVIDGRGGADTIYGLDGDDVICGGWGNDALHGGNGNDAIYGGSGANDRCNGGAGTDTAATCETRTSVP